MPQYRSPRRSRVGQVVWTVLLAVGLGLGAVLIGFALGDDRQPVSIEGMDR